MQMLWKCGPLTDNQSAAVWSGATQCGLLGVVFGKGLIWFIFSHCWFCAAACLKRQKLCEQVLHHRETHWFCFPGCFFFSVLVVLWHYQQMVRDVNIWRFQQLKLFQAQWHLQKKCVLFLYFLLLRSNEWPKLKHPLLHFIIWPISNLT